MLRPWTNFPIGYGDSGADPLVFCLPEGTNVDATVFKLFVTSKPTDFSFITQESPFRTTGRVYDARRRDVWGTAMITVVQKRDC
jgi:hypothetical protein